MKSANTTNEITKKEDEDRTEAEQIRISLIFANTSNSNGRETQLEVPSDPIAVPANIKRNGLNAIVNHLLNRRVVDDENDDDGDDDDKLPPISFEFVFSNKLLRNNSKSLEVLARNEGVSTEEVISIQYFIAQQSRPKNTGSSEQLPDWITSMTHSNNKNNEILSIGGHDGSIRVYSTFKQNTMKQEGIIKAHSGPIKCVSALSLNEGSSTMIASGSIDQTLVTHVYSNNNMVLHGVYGNGHFSSINSVSLLSDNKNKVKMASGDWDGGLCIWNVSCTTTDNEDTETSSIPKKKKMTTTTTISSLSSKEVSPILSIKAHASNISGIAWGYNNNNNNNNDSTILFTSSWDHTMKSWNLETSNNISTINCNNKVITCLSRCSNSNVCATGHPDCRIRLWDMRVSYNNSTKNDTNDKGGGLLDDTLQPSHHEWISSIQWSYTNPYLLSSASYDGTIKVWDIRSSYPLYTIRAHEKGEKSLCSCMTRDNILYSGGTDCIVKQYKF